MLTVSIDKFSFKWPFTTKCFVTPYYKIEIFPSSYQLEQCPCVKVYLCTSFEISILCDDFQIMAILNYHYKVYKSEAIQMFSNRETVAYYWNRFLHFFGLKKPVLPEPSDHILPPVRSVVFESIKKHFINTLSLYRK